MDARPPRIPWLAAALILIIGFGYCAFLGDSIRYYDETDYLQLTENLAAHRMLTYDGLRETAFRPPGYPLYMFLLRQLGAGLFVIRASQFLLLAGASLLLSILIKRSHGNRAAALSAALILCYPAFFYTAGTFYPQTLAAFLLLAAMVLLLRGAQVTPAAGLSAGLLMGALVLTVPTFAPTLACFVTWLFVKRRLRNPAAIACLLAPAILMVGGWTLRNYQAFHSLFFVSTNSGLNLFLGNNAAATPTSGVNIVLPEVEDESGSLNEAEKDAAYKNLAMQWMTTNPGACSKLYLGKLLAYFSFNDRLATESEERPIHAFILAVSYGPLLGLALLRLVRFRKQRLDYLEGLFLLLYIANALISAVFFCRIRFRLPYDFLLIGFVAIYLARLLPTRVRSSGD